MLIFVVQKSCPDIGRRKILLGRRATRWSERDPAYEHFYLALPFIVESLEIMNGTHPDIASIESTYADGWSQTDKRDLTSYIKALTDFEFIIGIISMYTLLPPLAGITQRLQGRAVDVAQAYQDVQTVILGMKGLREDIENVSNRI